MLMPGQEDLRITDDVGHEDGDPLFSRKNEKL